MALPTPTSSASRPRLGAVLVRALDLAAPADRAPSSCRCTGPTSSPPKARVDALVPSLTDPVSGQPASRTSRSASSASSQPHTDLRSWRRSRPLSKPNIGRSRSAPVDGASNSLSLASDQIGRALPIHCLATLRPPRHWRFTISKPAAIDLPASRAIALPAHSFLAPEPVAVSRDWAVEQLASTHSVARARFAVIAGRPGKRRARSRRDRLFLLRCWSQRDSRRRRPRLYDGRGHRERPAGGHELRLLPGRNPPPHRSATPAGRGVTGGENENRNWNAWPARRFSLKSTFQPEGSNGAFDNNRLRLSDVSSSRGIVCKRGEIFRSSAWAPDFEAQVETYRGFVLGMGLAAAHALVYSAAPLLVPHVEAQNDRSDVGPYKKVTSALPPFDVSTTAGQPCTKLPISMNPIEEMGEHPSFDMRLVCAASNKRVEFLHGQYI